MSPGRRFPPSLLVRPLAFLSRLNSWFKSWFIVGFSGKNSEPTVKQRKNVFSRKHRAHCLKAMPGYWCKIAKHCKQILLPEGLHSHMEGKQRRWNVSIDK